MMEHTRLCRDYRELYKEKLLAINGTKKVSAAVMAELSRRLDELEHRLDTFNIGINRERAEAAADARKKVNKQVGACSPKGTVSRNFRSSVFS
jgi:hypothetical protein